MPNHFTEQMKRKSDRDLRRMVERSSKYVPEAVDAAIEELELRKTGEVEFIDMAKLERERRAALRKGEPRSKPLFRYVKSFLNLVRHPSTLRIRTRTTNKKRLLLTTRFYFLTLFFLVVSAIPLMILEKTGLLVRPEQTDLIPKYFDNSGDIFLASLLIPIIAGVIEEAEFRLVLSRYNKKYFDLFLSLFGSHIISRIFGRYFITFSEYYSGFLVQSTLVYLIFTIPIYLTLSRTNVHSSWFENHWNSVYKYLFYVLAFLFAIAHLPTFDLSYQQLLFWPAIILPFLTYAFVFSYVRIRIGFPYAVLLHFTVDLVVILTRN